MDASAGKPLLHRYFEGVAAVMGLDQGRRRLELVFDDGHLVTWWFHAEKMPPAGLARFDADAASIIVRIREL